jgi:hypothetical protein
LRTDLLEETTRDNLRQVLWRIGKVLPLEAIRAVPSLSPDESELDGKSI